MIKYSIILITFLLSGSAFANDLDTVVDAEQYVNLGASSFSLQPKARSELAVLRITGPAGFQLNKTFAATEHVSVDMLKDASYHIDQPGKTDAKLTNSKAPGSLANGQYRWEVFHLSESGKLERTDRGTFFSTNGQALTRSEMQQRQTRASKNLIHPTQREDTRSHAQVNITNESGQLTDAKTSDTSVNTDGIGFASFSTDDFVRIDDAQADNSTLLSLRNSTGTGIFIKNDNDDFQVTDQNSAVKFHINNIAGATATGAGLGTTAPLGSFHIIDESLPEIILEQTGAPRYELEADTNSFQIVDDDFDNRLLVEDDSGDNNNNQLVIADNGNVGVNTDAPTSKLTVAGTNNARVAILNSDVSTVTSRVMVNMVNNGAPVVQMNDTAAGTQWNFRTGSGGRFVIDSPSGNNPQMQVFQTGNMSIKGTLTEGSSRTYKDDLQIVDEMAVLAKLRELNVSEWSYISEVGAGGMKRVRHVGPMAEDFYALFGLGADEKGIASLDTAGVALASIKALSKMVDEKTILIDQQQTTLKTLGQENDALHLRLEQLEKIVLSGQQIGDEVAVN